MNTTEWRKCKNPRSMLPYLQGQTSARKERLLAVAFCRRIVFLLTEDRCRHLLAEAQRFGLFQDGSTLPQPDYLRQLLADAERCADGLLAAEDLAGAGELADVLSRVLDDYFACYDASWGPIDSGLLATCEAAAAVYEMTGERVALSEVAASVGRAAYRASGGEDQRQVDSTEARAQCDVIRELFPRPPRAAKVEPVPLNSAVLGLAQAIYEEQAFDQMPILADALEDAGCTDTVILDHLRGPGPHVRGCFAVDLILGKE